MANSRMAICSVIRAYVRGRELIWGDPASRCRKLQRRERDPWGAALGEASTGFPELPPTLHRTSP